VVRYWQDEEQTKAVTEIDEEDGQVWMCTGDKAVMDEEGYVQSERSIHLSFISVGRLTLSGTR
jgi:long-subunit acyl-CoA synthetase (AMP-forming)